MPTNSQNTVHKQPVPACVPPPPPPKKKNEGSAVYKMKYKQCCFLFFVFLGWSSELCPFIFPELVVADRASVMDILQAGDAEWDQTTATGNVWRKDTRETGVHGWNGTKTL